MMIIIHKVGHVVVGWFRADSSSTCFPCVVFHTFHSVPGQDGPQQSNESDCGPFSLQALEFLARDRSSYSLDSKATETRLPLTVEGWQGYTLRQTIFLELIQGRLFDRTTSSPQRPATVEEIGATQTNSFSTSAEALSARTLSTRALSSEIMDRVCIFEWQILRLLQHWHRCPDPIVTPLTSEIMQSEDMERLKSELDKQLKENALASSFIHECSAYESGLHSEPRDQMLGMYTGAILSLWAHIHLRVGGSY